MVLLLKKCDSKNIDLSYCNYNVFVNLVESKLDIIDTATAD